jgi:SRSO17 transposase
MEVTMTTDEIRALEPNARRRLEEFRDCFKKAPVFDYLVSYSLGLLATLERKSIEPIALWIGVAVRTLQLFLSQFIWDHARIESRLRRMIVDQYGNENSIGVIDASAHAKQGDKTPGVQRQWCGESGKIDNCVVGQHLIYTNNDPNNPFSACVASDVYLPECWIDDPDRCKTAHIPEEAVFRTKWEMAADQVDQCAADGVRFGWITCDEEFTSVPEFIYRMDRSGQRVIGEIRSNFRCWTKRPVCHSFQGPHASKQVDNVCRFSPLFSKQEWKRLRIKETTRGACVWDVKAARVHLVTKDARGRSCPTDRPYWLIVARNPETEEIKYFVCNASENTPLEEMLRVAFARWHVEKWFERAKQQCGFGSFEVRTYQSLIRHWLCSRIAMYILATETTRLREKKSADHIRASFSGTRPNLAAVA